jgi:D-proline reductase (dithiol) PrdB
MLVSTGRDLRSQVKAPLTAFVNFPMGNPFGRPFDKVAQRRVLLEALHILGSVTEGGALIDLPCECGEEFGLNLGTGYARS